jgi:hypothetical protein
MPTFDEILDQTIAAMPEPGAEPVEAPAVAEGETPAEGAQVEDKPTPEGGEKPEGEKPAGEGEEGDKETTEEKPAAAAKEEPKPDGGMARKLALVAREERRLKADKAALEADKAKLKPELELGGALREARAMPSKLEGAKKALALDDEGVAELYLELHEHLGGAGGEKAAAATKPEVRIEKLVDRKVAERLAAAKEEAKAQQTALEERGKQIFAADVHTVLKAAPSSYRFCAVAPPSVPDIAAITEELARGAGRMPSPEEVLKTIEDHRRELYEGTGESSKPEPKKTATKTAPGKGEPGGKQTPPIRRDDAPVNTSTKRLSFDELLDLEIAALEQR